MASKIEELSKVDLFEKEVFNKIDLNINKNIEEARESQVKINSNIESYSKSELNRDSRSSNQTYNNINVLKPAQYNIIRSAFEKSLNEKDKSFGKSFSHTQLFLNYFEDLRVKKLKMIFV